VAEPIRASLINYHVFIAVSAGPLEPVNVNRLNSAIGTGQFIVPAIGLQDRIHAACYSATEAGDLPDWWTFTFGQECW
jgi:hypothetical protein